MEALIVIDQTVESVEPEKAQMADFGLEYFRELVLQVIETITKTDDEWLLPRLSE